MRKGVGVSRGIAIGKALVYKNSPVTLTGKQIPVTSVATEKERVTKAVDETLKELQTILEGLDPEQDEMMVDLIEIQMEFAKDPMLVDKIINHIEISMNTASDAVMRAADDISQMFLAMDDEYYKTRSADIEDVGRRIVDHVLGRENIDLSHLSEPYVIFAEDLTPSETVTMDKENVIGMVTKKGSATSHTAILARILGVPAIVGAEIDDIYTGQSIIVDGSTGEYIINPNQSQQELYKKRRKYFLENQEYVKQLRDLPAETKDGTLVKLSINIGDPREVQNIAKVGADGVGLFRTEFLYMNQSHLPTEAEQFNAYRTAAIHANGKPVIIRTLDVGGDKTVESLKIPNEDNPFLGYRAIRVCLDNPELFRTQLRAILRASTYGNLQIMFPMICCRSELLRAKQILEQCKESLDKENIQYNEDIFVGMMIEVPSTATMADIFAKDVDFFSIGTNDLAQYTLAVDRMNQKISSLYTCFNPGVIRLIKTTIDAGKSAGIPVGMCGEMSMNVAATPLLLGLGLDEFSVSSPDLPYVKDRIRNLTINEAKMIADKVLTMNSATAIEKYLEGLIA